MGEAGGRKAARHLMDDYDLEYIEGLPWRSGYWIARDGLYEAYGLTVDEAIDELHRNMGDRECS